MKFDVMECFRMYYILVSLLFIAVGQSEAGDIEYQGKLPQTVFVGDNVTFQWLYTGTEKVAITLFRIFENSYETLIYYGVKLKDSKPQIKHNNIKKIATTAKWDGDYENNQYNFTLVNVTDFAHQKNFSIQLELDNGPGTLLLGFTKDLLLVSVIPEVQLQIEKTNVSVGDRVTIRCNTVTEGRPEVTISLYRNNTFLESTKTRSLSYSKEHVELKDAGSYRCKAKNNAGEDNSEIMKITVHEKKEEDKKEEGNPVGNPSAGKSDGLGGGAIAGIVVGILVLVVIIVVLVIIFLKRRTSVPKSNKRATVNDDESKSAMVSKPEKDQVWL